MEAQKKIEEAQPTLCKGNCGFYGAPSTGYCSKCAKQLGLTPAAPPQTAPAPSAAAPAMPPFDLGASAAAPQPPPQSSTGPSPLNSVATSVAAASAAAAAAVAAPSSALSTPAMTPLVGAAASAALAGIPDAPLGSPALGGAAGPAAGAGADADDDKTQKNRSRCWSCKKKVGLTGFDCRCGYAFCGTHRYADAHACSFDYVSHDRAVLAKNNERVVGAKLEKI